MKKIYLSLLCIFAVSVSFAQNATWKTTPASGALWNAAANWTLTGTGYTLPNAAGTTTFSQISSTGSIVDANFTTKQVVCSNSVNPLTRIYSDGQAKATVAIPFGANLGSTAAGDGVTINGLVYTSVNGTPANPGEWDYSGSYYADATALAAAISTDTRTGTLGKVSAYSYQGSVIVVAQKDGTGGNAVTLTSYVSCTGPSNLSGGAISTNVLTLDPASTNTNYINSTNSVFIINPTANSAKLVIDCKVKVASSGAGGVSNIFLTNNSGHTMEFGSNSVLDISPTNGGDLLAHSVNGGTYNFMGSIIGTKGLMFSTSLTTYNFLPGATVGSGVTLRFYNSGGTVNVNMNDNELLYSGTIWASNDGTLNVNATNSLASNLTVSGGKKLTLNVNKSLSGMKSITLGVPGDILFMTMATNKTISFDAQTDTWGTGKLQITGFVPGKIRFGTDNTGLSAAQLAQITLLGGSDAKRPVRLDASGYLEINTTTWDGSTWSNNAPTSGAEAIIAGPYSTTTNGAITANKLTVSASPLGSLTINSGTNVTVTNEVINNAGANGIVIENNANLIQTNNVANTGAITISRASASLFREDYSLWSSPTGITQKLNEFSPDTYTGRFYTYNSSTNLYNVTADNTPFATGTGYLIRMPNTWVDYPGTSASWTGSFTGIPNNGNVNLTTVAGYNAIGNPYPSTLDANAFIDANLIGTGTVNKSIDGTLYFWRKRNSAPIVSSAYATYTKLGAVANDGGITPLQNIQVGQGFFVNNTSSPLVAPVSFTNAMRTSNTSSPFLRTKAVAQPDRVWLNLSQGTDLVNQMLVGYMDGATTGVDNGIDGKYINDSATALTSNIDGGEYVIQGRPAFDASDVVALNFKTANAGTYTIAKDHADGVFAAGQDVYLVDATTGTETNLQTDAYTFTATAGVSNARFSLKYQKTLGVNANTFNDNSVTVYRNSGTINVTSGANAISSIKVYDIQGRVIAEQKNVNANTATVNNLKASNQVLLVKVTSADNSVVTKKVIN